uniref:Uncharacterized protein n=1 Tax=Arundo donax TaxID=35708 RepID=A0A0A9C4Z6_ARUDO
MSHFSQVPLQLFRLALKD